MTEYCEICGEELDSEDEEVGICKSCKAVQKEEKSSNEDFVDPGIA